MIITLSGYDGVGKSTSVNLLKDLICDKYHLTGMSALQINNDSEVYNSLNDVNRIYDQLSQYDVISTRFYFRSKKMQEYQDKVMFTGVNVFDNSDLIKQVADLARQEASIWYEHVISKLLKDNKIVIYDRYFYDEVAYRALYNLDKKYIESLYQGYTPADIRFYLYADMPLIRKRNASRIDMKTALFNSNKKMQELYENIEYIYKKYDMTKVDVRGKTKEQVANELLSKIDFSFLK